MRKSFVPFFSGSAATMTRLIVVLGVQVFMVPLFLKGWSVGNYGVWIAIQTVAICFSIPDTALQNYMEANYLRRSRGCPKKLTLLICKGISTGVLLSGIQFCLALLFVLIGGVEWLHLSATESSTDASHLNTRWVLLICVLAYWPASGVSGVLGRASVSFGSIAPQVWCAILTTAFGATAPALVAYFKGSMIEAALAYFVATATSGTLATIYFTRFFAKRNISTHFDPKKASWKLVLASMGLLVKGVADLTKAQGFRLIAAAILGPLQMAQISILKTVVGLLQQLYSVLTGPLYPKFLISAAAGKAGKNDAVRLAKIELAVCALLIIPLGIAIDWWATDILNTWTHGKVAYDRNAYYLLFSGAITTAYFFPVVQMIQAQSMVREQGWLAAISVMSMLVGIALFAKCIGSLGVPFGMLTSEVITAFSIYGIFSKSEILAEYFYILGRSLLLLLSLGYLCIGAAYISSFDGKSLYWFVCLTCILCSIQVLKRIKINISAS